MVAKCPSAPSSQLSSGSGRLGTRPSTRLLSGTVVCNPPAQQGRACLSSFHTASPSSVSHRACCFPCLCPETCDALSTKLLLAPLLCPGRCDCPAGINVSSKVSSGNSAAKTLRLGFLWWCALASQGAAFRPLLPLMQQIHTEPDTGVGEQKSPVFPTPSHAPKSLPSVTGGKELGLDPHAHACAWRLQVLE